MKNIYVIPTDKPSRLFEILRFNFVFDNQNKYSEEYKKIHKYKNQHIYITDNSEIKENNWCLSKLNEVVKFGKKFTTSLYKKIILTTDDQLIQDGVQAIDDEFLEWFVKNPICEFVEVYNIKSVGYPYDEYSIIVPEEEPTMVDKLKEYFKNTPKEQVQKDWEESCKATEGINSPTVDELIEAQKSFNKQEISISDLEEKYKLIPNNLPFKQYVGGYIDGIKNTENRMYSKEDVFSIIASLLHTPKLVENGSWEEIGDWFEQFKKK
jgi:hypothetical protein